MKIEVKLVNPKYCEGCPFLRINSGFYYYCHYCDYKIRNPEFVDSHVRPKKCIKENGE